MLIAHSSTSESCVFSFAVLLSLRHNTTSPWPWHHCLNNMLVRNLPWCLLLHIGMKGSEWKRGQKPSDASSRAAAGFKSKTSDAVTENNSWWCHGEQRTFNQTSSFPPKKGTKGEDKQRRWRGLRLNEEGREKQESRGVQGGRCVHTSGWQARSELRGALPCLG